MNRPRRMAWLHHYLCASLLAAFSIYNPVRGQITEIITDYNGFWKSGRDSATISPIKPDNSHNLLAFKYNGTYYSTGVNNTIISNKGITFTTGNYRALPLTSIAAPTTSTLIGLGEMYDGAHNGAPTTAPVNNIPFYLTDGPKGLNLGTAVFNLPSSVIRFDVSNFQVPKIGDNIPDLLVTQMGATENSSLDSLYFTDANGTLVGNAVVVRFTGVDTLGLGAFDFYTASNNPMMLNSANSNRAMRIFATDLSAFGLNSTNVTTIKYFNQKLSGTSDIAFTAYNTEAIKILPLNNPGGFATLPSLWLKANDGTSSVTNNSKVPQWQDRGPSDFSLEQSSATVQPQFKNGVASGFNFNPYINFDNSNRLVSLNSPFSSETGNGDFFIIGRPTSTTAANKVIGFSRSQSDNSTSNQGDFPSLSYTTTGASLIDNAAYSSPLTSTTTSLNTSYLWRAEYQNGISVNFYKNGTADGSSSSVASNVGKYSFQLGDAAPGDNGSDFDLAEVIVFPVNLTDSQRVKVETYLAVKYGLTISHNYVNAASQAIWDLSANTGYNNNLFGIGREDAQGFYQKQSKSETANGMVTLGITAIATENNANLNTLSNITYSITGDNGGSLAWQTNEKPAKIDQRIGREWKVRETGTVGTLLVQIPASSSTAVNKLPEPATCKMFLLVDNDGDFSSGIINQVEMTLNGTNWEGSYNFADGNYFTFATENKDYSDLSATWPSASAGIAGCDVNKDGLYNSTDNNGTKLLVWAGPSVTAETTANITNTDAADDGLQTASSILVANASNQFNVLLNGNITGTTVYYRLWFDWNNDGNFANDDGIDVTTLSTIPATYAGSAVVTGSGSTTVAVQVHPPASFSLQYKTRLIVSDVPITDMYRTSGSTYQFAISNGEVEDYNAIIILPVTLKNFTAIPQGCAVLAQWQTATEQNSSTFIVEHSTDSRTYTTSSTVTAKNIATGSSYRSLTETLSQGTHYFRLKMIDKDGKIAYSAVEKVNIECSKSILVVSPNPVKDNLYISGLPKQAQLIITDAAGRMLLSKNTGTATSTQLSLQGWVAGLYHLQVFVNGHPIETHKFLKTE